MKTTEDCKVTSIPKEGSKIVSWSGDGCGKVSHSDDGCSDILAIMSIVVTEAAIDIHPGMDTVLDTCPGAADKILMVKLEPVVAETAVDTDPVTIHTASIFVVASIVNIDPTGLRCL